MNRFARQRSLKTVLALALAFASGTAAALGLGQIELKSKLGEPLLAEIPIVSNDPAELEQLRAGLASPETFARVGLQAPDVIVANLQFTSALDASGNPVIRVTSVQPINQPLLTFLIEVDWGQGRLVREYSTLLDAPRTVSAPLQPAIEAPVLAPSNTIVRAPQVAPAPETTPEPSPAIKPESVAVVPVPDNAIPVPAPAPTPAAAVSPPPPALVERPSELDAVERGETLSQIAGRLDLGVSLDQTMVALLRANPNAFINDNINLLKQGAVLRVPERSQVASIGAAQASALVRSQVQQWREAQRPVPQPAIANASAANSPATTAAPAAAPSAPAAGGARLEIVPPGASGAKRAGTQSGITAGGEGEMLRQELQQTKETLAARDAELAEMQSRIAELEKLQGDQQQLLSMKDSELAAVQQRLASSQQAAAGTPPPAETARSSSLPWVFGGAALLLLALLGGWLMRRRAASAPRFRAPATKSTSSLADAFAPGLVPAGAGSSKATVVSPAPEPTPAGPTDTDDRADATPAGDTAAAASDDGPLPFWDRRGERTPRPSGRQQAPVAAKPSAPSSAPAWHDASAKSKLATPAIVTGASSADAAMQTHAPTDVPGQQRLELARAYLDLGDHDSARQLLGEVAVNGDPDDRQQATRMLRELG